MAKRKVEQSKAQLDKVRLEAEMQMKVIQETAEKRAAELQKRVDDAEEAAKIAEEEELELYENTMAYINKLCKETGYFCGVVLTKQDLLTVIDMAIETKDNIRIPFRLYIDETAEKENNEQTKTIKN